MLDERPTQRFNPDQMNAGLEADGEKKEAIERSSLSDIIGDKPFLYTEGDLQGAEKEQGVSVDRSRTGEERIIFDRRGLNEAEKKKVLQFQELIRTGGKEALRGTRFEWFLSDEDNDFLEDLADFLEQRIEEMTESGSTTSLQNYGFSDKMVSAMQSFREMARREEMRLAIDQQVKRLPIQGFRGRLRPGKSDSRTDGDIIELRFNPNDMNDSTNEVEVMLVKSPSGQNELIFSLKDAEKYQSLAPDIMGPAAEESAKAGKKFWFSDSDPVQRIDEADNSDGTNFSRFEFGISRGGSDVPPLFTRVKIFRKANDLSKAIDTYVEQKRREKEEEERREEEKKRKAQLQQYSSQQPTPPSTPSSASSSYKWSQQPQTYVRSG